MIGEDINRRKLIRRKTRKRDTNHNGYEPKQKFKLFF